ncbi:hypothetical protein F4W58_18450 [Proteus mirabilis]|nr:hypothetical protein F4W58_18450 [Proteus mirabilis]QGM73946.1 hypothetical protein F4W59_18440 [Proteus mirabilis]
MILRTIIIKSLSDAPPSGSYERTTLLTLLPVFYFSQPGAGFFFLLEWTKYQHPYNKYIYFNNFMLIIYE